MRFDRVWFNAHLATLAGDGLGGDATLDLNNQSQTYATLPDTVVTMTGRSQLRITASTSPMTGSMVHLNSPD